MFELLFLNGPRAGAVIPVPGRMLAGRDPECGIEVPDPRVSRAHARLDWDGVRLSVTDTQSSNGTYVNEEAVTTTMLADGDVIRLGATRLQAQRPRAGDGLATPTAPFGLADGREPELSHSVSMQKLDRADGGHPAELQRRLASMIKISEVLASKSELKDLFEPVLDTLFGLLPQTDRGFLLLGESAESLKPRAVRQGPQRGPSELRVSRSICRAALERRAAILYRDGGSESIDAGRSVVDLHIRSAIAVPLVVGEEVIGIVVIDTRDAARAYTQEDLELAAAICLQAAISIKNALLLREVAAQTATRNNLMRFLPEAMADQVLRGEIDGGLGGRSHRGAIMFSDLIGFTARAESMAPQQLVAFMNDYFDRLVPCIEREAGSIDKFMGDAIMAVWGIPIEPEVASSHAITAGLRMQTALAGFNADLTEPFHMGVGVAAGVVVAGNIGTAKRLEYTVLGDTVNTAQRIGAAACREQVLVSREAWHDLKGNAFGTRMPMLSVKNKAEPLQTYSVRGIARDHAEVQLFVPITIAGHACYLLRRLTDGNFLLLHPQIELERMTMAAVELAATDLGMPKIIDQLPHEDQDGTLRRSIIGIVDGSLGGLLSEAAVDCPHDWESMARGAPRASSADESSPAEKNP